MRVSEIKTSPLVACSEILNPETQVNIFYPMMNDLVLTDVCNSCQYEYTECNKYGNIYESPVV